MKGIRLPILSIIATIAILACGLFPYPEISYGPFNFVGRFHPLIVHLPIGFILAVLILQLIPLFTKSELRIAIKVMLWITMISSVASVIFGTLLALSGGYSETLLDRHRWLGVGTCIACIWLYQSYSSKRKGSNIVYTFLLILSMALVGGAGHFGGALTHGENYLTAYLPTILGGKEKTAPVPAGTKEDTAIFDRVIQPIIDNKCVACHSQSKSNGNLKMNSLEALVKGGNTGPALIAHNALESLMIQRANLPIDHKEHMPPKGKVQLTSTERETITWWINNGSKKRMSLNETLPPDNVVTFLESSLGFKIAPPNMEMLSWEQVTTAHKELKTDQTINIRRLSLDSPSLSVQILPNTNITENQINQLDAIKANITELDMNRTVYDDKVLEVIGSFANLEKLNLGNTSLQSTEIDYITDLRKLKKINLIGTKIDDTALDKLLKFPDLQAVITSNTKVTSKAAKKFKTEKVDKTKQLQIKTKIKKLKDELNELDVEIIGPTEPKKETNGSSNNNKKKRSSNQTGQGEFTYQVVLDWGKIPNSKNIGITHGGVVVDKSGKVYVGTKGKHNLVVYDQHGEFIKAFGSHTHHFHGMTIQEKNGKQYIYGASMAHVSKIDLDGNLVLKIEGKKQALDNQWTKATAVAVTPNGDIFIADGYDTNVIFKYSKEGEFIKKFGTKGTSNGQFKTSHGLAIDSRNPQKPLLIVCDRENNRLQRFDLEGNFVDIPIEGLRRPCSISIWSDYMLIAELAGRAIILDKNYKLISILGDNPDLDQRANFSLAPEKWEPTSFSAPHGCSFDASGNIYIQEWNIFGRITKLERL